MVLVEELTLGVAHDAATAAAAEVVRLAGGGLGLGLGLGLGFGVEFGVELGLGFGGVPGGRRARRPT